MGYDAALADAHLDSGGSTMNARLWHVGLIAVLMFTLSPHAQAQNNLPVPVPAGTTVYPPKYAEDQPALQLKPAEQVAFLYVYGLWFMEQDCLDGDSGVGRLCTLRELITGVKTPDGGVIGLSVNPVKDTNYNYEIMIIGDSCLIRATPRAKGLVGFAVLGSPRRSFGSVYYSPDGADMTRAVPLIEMGYEGSGFRK
jgi:hypothetical protein